jgi:hypothetical protein
MIAGIAKIVGSPLRSFLEPERLFAFAVFASSSRRSNNSSLCSERAESFVGAATFHFAMTFRSDARTLEVYRLPHQVGQRQLRVLSMRVGQVPFDERAEAQPLYSRLAGYEDVNDAERLSQDPAFRLIVLECLRNAPAPPRPAFAPVKAQSLKAAGRVRRSGDRRGLIPTPSLTGRRGRKRAPESMLRPY